MNNSWEKVAKYASQDFKKILKEKQEARERPSKSNDVADRKPLFFCFKL